MNGTANATFSGTHNGSQRSVFSYSLDLDTPYTPTTAGNYWFCIGATPGSDDFDSWLWAGGDGDPFLRDWAYIDDGTSNVWLNPGGTSNPTGFAFELTGEAISDTVPEPTTLALFGVGLVGMAVRRFRRKQTAIIKSSYWGLGLPVRGSAFVCRRR